MTVRELVQRLREYSPDATVKMRVPLDTQGPMTQFVDPEITYDGGVIFEIGE